MGNWLSFVWFLWSTFIAAWKYYFEKVPTPEEQQKLAEESREKARLYAYEKGKLARIAVGYANKGVTKKAKQFQEQAKEHEEKSKEENKKASKILFEAVNKKWKGDLGVIDLHSLYTKEALVVLEERVKECKKNEISHLTVIVGKGHHSKDGAKLKPAVEKWLEGRECTVITNQRNEGRLEVDFHFQAKRKKRKEA
eukprot:TRINITY_DN2904_c0_g1_i1.p1 TRINITY_DN2904_c0_g1~~TRINITY_DN2904_c0_g1_i1.p1  ORF type:complete len:196 (+),score=51.55 TRINITY_DN2904_c0_g1_i1:231-818(+)